MKDNRQLAIISKEAVDRRTKLILRMKLPNNHISERILEPVMHASNAADIYYSHYSYNYMIIKDGEISSLDNLDYALVKLHHKDVLSTTTTSNGVINGLIETLLSSGYQLCTQ